MCFVKQTQGLEERQEISTEKATEILFYISDQILGNMRRDTDTCNRRFKHRPEEELKAWVQEKNFPESSQRHFE